MRETTRNPVTSQLVCRHSQVRFISEHCRYADASIRYTFRVLASRVCPKTEYAVWGMS
jgi:hypothetical protein